MGEEMPNEPNGSSESGVVQFVPSKDVYQSVGLPPSSSRMWNTVRPLPGNTTAEGESDIFTTFGTCVSDPQIGALKYEPQSCPLLSYPWWKTVIPPAYATAEGESVMPTFGTCVSGS